jgi:hypothetical protein
VSADPGKTFGHVALSTPASISDDERLAIVERAQSFMDEWYKMRVVTELYWPRL